MKKITAAGSTLAYLLAASPVFAQTSVNPCPTDQVDGGVNFDILCKITPDGGFIGSLITAAFVIAALIALFFLIFGGIKWIVSGGDKGGVEAARNMIVAALVGLVIVFLSYFILSLLFSFFNLGSISSLELPKLDLGTE